MTATYSGNPLTDQKDAVRFLVHDTDMASPRLQDEEILWALTEHSNLYLAAALCADQIATQVSGGVKRKRVGDLQLDYGQGVRVEFAATAARLRAQAALSATPYAGGLTWSDRLRVELDRDRLSHWARIGQHDHRENHQDGGPYGSTGPDYWPGE